MLGRLYRKSRFAVLFNFSDEKAFGRTVMMASSTLGSMISLLTGGLFYPSFLMMYGINPVNIGIITFIPYIANCFSIFIPSILFRYIAFALAVFEVWASIPLTPISPLSICPLRIRPTISPSIPWPSMPQGFWA